MKIVAIDGTYRPKESTFQLTQRALEGAAAEGAQTEHVLLVEKNIRFCTNCLACYRDLDSPMPRCPLSDDVQDIVLSIRAADGLLLASPLRGGLPTALMFQFLERALFLLARPTGSAMGMQGCPEPRQTEKTGVAATLVSAGCATTEFRPACDMATPVLAWYASCFVNGLPIGDLYAAACFPRKMETADWSRAFLLRQLTGAQLQEAYDLGARMARRIQAGNPPPYSSAFFNPPADAGAPPAPSAE